MRSDSDCLKVVFCSNVPPLPAQNWVAESSDIGVSMAITSGK